ncbi:MAG: hypothetical protein ACMXYM_03315 [Candidatus Woesearchaeota archaeon]
MYSDYASLGTDPLSYDITRVLVQLGIEPGITSEGPYFAVPVRGLNVLAQHVTTTDERGALVEAVRVYHTPPTGLQGAVHRAGTRELHAAARILTGTHGFDRVILG